MRETFVWGVTRVCRCSYGVGWFVIVRSAIWMCHCRIDGGSMYGHTTEDRAKGKEKRERKICFLIVL